MQPGWYFDPQMDFRLRWWDGGGWSERGEVRPRYRAREWRSDTACGTVVTLGVMATSLALSSAFVVMAGQAAPEPLPADDMASMIGLLAGAHLAIGLVLFTLVSFAGGRRHPWLAVLWSILGGGAGLAVGFVFGVAASMNGQELC